MMCATVCILAGVTEKNDKIVALDAELMSAIGIVPFTKQDPERKHPLCIAKWVLWQRRTQTIKRICSYN